MRNTQTESEAMCTWSALLSFSKGSNTHQMPEALQCGQAYQRQSQGTGINKCYGITARKNNWLGNLAYQLV